MTDTHDDGAEQQQADEEREWRLEQAVRECLTRGVSMESIRIICFESGANYARITGEPK